MELSAALPEREAAEREAAGQVPAEADGTVPDLLPPIRTEPAERGNSRREPPGRVTIGTIEVTVVPPAQPAPPAEPLPAEYRAAPRFAEAETARLRDGLRRWYGIAQG